MRLLKSLTSKLRIVILALRVIVMFLYTMAGVVMPHGKAFKNITSGIMEKEFEKRLKLDLGRELMD